MRWAGQRSLRSIWYNRLRTEAVRWSGIAGQAIPAILGVTSPPRRMMFGVAAYGAEPGLGLFG